LPNAFEQHDRRGGCGIERFAAGGHRDRDPLIGEREKLF